jgi:transcriptional regulator with XRE-family HTH domain
MKPIEIISIIKNTRKEKNLSLRQLAELTGLSKGYLSKIENMEDKLPSISTLHRIVAALGIDLSDLFTDQTSKANKSKITLLRKKDRKEMIHESQGVRYKHWPLAHKKIGRNIDPYIIEFPKDTHEVYQHEGEEFYLMIEGKAEIGYGKERYLLGEGDCIYFDSDVPHTGRSISENPAKALMIFYTYKRVLRQPFSDGLLFSEYKKGWEKSKG